MTTYYLVLTYLSEVVRDSELARDPGWRGSSHVIAGDISAPGTTKRIVHRTLEFAAYAYLYGEIEQVEEQARALDTLPEACSATCIEPAYMRRAHRPGRCTHHTRWPV